MTESQSSPKLIYLHIQNLVNELLGKLDEQNIHSETDIDPSECPTRELLVAFHKKITEQLEVLEKNAEWNTYTIAFYGETNAGKSTIIESLRLLLEEELKIQQQEKFQSWQNESGFQQVPTKCFVKTLRVLSKDSRPRRLNGVLKRMSWKKSVNFC